MGARFGFPRSAGPGGLTAPVEMVNVLGELQVEELKGSTLLRKEPIGVCGLITPWNWPMNQIVCKVGRRLAVRLHRGPQAERNCAASVYLFTEILHKEASQQVSSTW